MNVFYYTFGCKVNQYETENIREKLEDMGYSQVSKIELAQICIINTCTVTAQSDTKCRQLIHKIRSENPSCVLVLAGCLPQAFPNKAIEMLECDIIVGSKNKTKVPELIQSFLENRNRIVEIDSHNIGDKIEAMLNSSVDNKTRAYIKIQDGCDMHCTYCIIPKARGHIRSKSLEDIKKETNVLSNNGHREIVLTGINLCCYGRDFKNGTRLIDAIETVCMVEGDFRVRLGSIEPEMISDDDIIRMKRLDKLCPQFHLSLQSGCDKTLSAMKRHYTSTDFYQLCEKLRIHFPNCAITTDIMVGFPQETDEDFNNSLNFVKKVQFADAHIFPYSRRTGTIADTMSGQVDKSIKQNRAIRMSEACNKSRERYLSTLINTTQNVLFEKENSSEYHQGYCDNYVLVKVLRKYENVTLKRKLLKVKITGVKDNFCIGEFTE